MNASHHDVISEAPFRGLRRTVPNMLEVRCLNDKAFSPRMPTPDPLAAPPGRVNVVIDGKSLCHVTDTRCELARLEDAVEQISALLRPIEGASLRVYFDASLIGQLSASDRRRLDDYTQSGRFRQGSAGIELDPVFLEWALRYGALVVSKDLFRNHRDKFPFVGEPGRTFAADFDPDSRSWAFYARNLPRGTKPRTIAEEIALRAAVTNPPSGSMGAPVTVGSALPQPATGTSEPAAPRITDRRRFAEDPPSQQSSVQDETDRRASPRRLVLLSEFASSQGLHIGDVITTLARRWPGTAWHENSVLDEAAREAITSAPRRIKPREKVAPTIRERRRVTDEAIRTSIAEVANELGITTERAIAAAQRVWPKRHWSATSTLNEVEERTVRHDARSAQPRAHGTASAPTPAGRSEPTHAARASIAEVANELGITTERAIAAAQRVWPKRHWSATSTLNEGEELLLTSATNPTKSPSGSPRTDRPRDGGMRSIRQFAQRSRSTVAEVIRVASILWPGNRWEPSSRLTPLQQQDLLRSLRPRE